MVSIERTAIVTGGGKRVGDAIVRALLEDGWTVIAHVHHDDDPVADGAVKSVADLEAADCADRIFDTAEGHPPVRLLVNNAARFAFDGFGQANAAEFDSHMAVNARAPMLLIDRMAQEHRGGEALVVNLLLISANGLMTGPWIALAVTIAASNCLVELYSPRGTDDFTMATTNALLCLAFGAWVI